MEDYDYNEFAVFRGGDQVTRWMDNRQRVINIANSALVTDFDLDIEVREKHSLRVIWRRVLGATKYHTSFINDDGEWIEG